MERGMLSGAPILRNKLLFSIVARRNHEHPMIRVVHHSETSIVYDDVDEHDEIIFETQREAAAGAGWPKCGCHQQCKACWPYVIIQDGLEKRFVSMRVTPEHYAGLK